MNVSDLYPVYYAEDFEAAKKMFSEDMGFSVKHGPQIEHFDYAVLENDKGRRVDIVRSHYPNDDFKEGFLGMRVNVDNFYEGVAYFEALGYSLFGEAHETKSSVLALLVKDGSNIIIYHHKK